MKLVGYNERETVAAGFASCIGTLFDYNSTDYPACSMPRTTPTKQSLNQAIRADIPGGDCLLDLLNSLHIVRRYNLTDECHGLLDFIHNRLKSIRARMREAVIAKTDPTAACKAIADEVIQDLRNRLKDSRYCKRKKLKADHVDYCKKFCNAFQQFVNVLEGRLDEN